MATVKEPKNNLEIRARVEVAKTLMGLDDSNCPLYKIKTPGFGTEHAWSGTMYDIRFIEGIGVTADEALARQIVLEFPNYELIEA